MTTKRKSRPSKMVSLRLPADVADWVATQAKTEGVTMTRWLIRQVTQAHETSMIAQQIASQMAEIADLAARQAAREVTDAARLADAMEEAARRAKARRQQRAN